MAFRQRTPTFRPQLSVRRVYETMQPRSEIKETSEAYLLHVYLPGFPRNSVKITYVGSSQMVKITGERPIQGNRWTRFEQTYPVPENCEPEALQGKFEFGTLILTMPKKLTPQVAPKPEDLAKEAKPEKTQESTSQQSTTTKVEEPLEDKAQREDTSSQKEFETKPTPTMPTKIQNDEQPQKGQEEIGPKSKPSMETKVQKDEKPQKGHEEIEPKPTQPMETKVQNNEKPQKGQEVIGPKPNPPITTQVQKVEMPQKDQEEIEPKSTPPISTKVKTDEKAQKGQEEIEPKPTLSMTNEVPKDYIPQKGQEEIEPTPTKLATMKEQLDEKKVEESDEEADEKERITKEKDIGKPSESRNPAIDKEKGNFKEEENRTKKLRAKKAEEHSVPKVPKKEKESIAEGKWNDEENRLVINIGAAILVIASLGAYVSYKFAS